jgi:GNAT superfamily N-acetyltransferase
MNYQIRAAQKGDENAIMALIQALANYERAPEQVVNTSEKLGIDLFEDKICHAFVAEVSSSIVGFALYFTNYSTWKGRCLYLEDLYVLDAYRELGIGSALFDQVVTIAKEQGVKRMDWQVLDWNQPALRFYEKKKATLDPTWVNGRLFF